MGQPSFLKTKLWVYDLEHKSDYKNKIKIEIGLLNQAHLVFYYNTRGSDYILRVLEPITLGLDNSLDQKEFWRRLILSCNLALDDSIFSLHEINSTEPEGVDLSEELSLIAKLSPDKAFEINHIGSRKRHTKKIFYNSELLDESQVCQTIIRLNKLYEMSASRKIQVSDLKKSLEQFSLAMTAVEKLSCFSHLYSSLELALNCDGNHRRNKDEFDAKVSELTDEEKTYVKRWREFNNRVKHADRNSDDQMKYLTGKNNLDVELSHLRMSVSKLIYHRLKNDLNLSGRIPNHSLLKLPTHRLIKKFGPMLNESELEEYESMNEPIFDVVFYHRSDTKTIWGNPKQYFNNSDLRSLANNIFDLIIDGYEVWIRDTSIEGKIAITSEHVRYAMSLEADNMEEIGIALAFQIIDGWLVISLDPDSDEMGPIAQKFYDHFEILVDLSDAPRPHDDKIFERYLENKKRKAQPRWRRLRMKVD